MGDDITIGVTEIVNNIEVTAQPNDQIVEIDVVDNSDEVTLNITPTVIEININKGSSFARWGDILGNLPDQEDLQNVLNLKADLVGGLVPASQLPSYVDDIIEVANYAALPTTGEVGKIYVTLDNNKIFRWSGSVYIEIAANTGVWGAITGTLSSQTDLQTALDTKALKTITITPSAPLSGGGDLSANRTISISQSNATTDGYLSSTDWNKFNNNIPAGTPTTGDFVQYNGSNLAYRTITASSPLSFNSGTGTFSISQATTSTNGYLSSTDWNAFNNTVESVAASSPLGSTGGKSPVISITQATTSSNGYLSSTDWNTFNGKQAALSGTGFVKISGTTISYDNSTYALDNSVVHLAGTETITGVKTFSSQMTAAKILMSNSSSDRSLELTNSSSGQSIYVVNTGSGSAIQNLNNGNSGIGFMSANSITATGNLYQGNFNGGRVFSVGSQGAGYFAGSVGIGTTSPLTKLHIEGDASSTTDETVLTLKGNGENGKRIDFRNAFGSLARITGTKLAGGPSADEGILTFETATNSVLSEKMRITDSGRVGINETNPLAKLHATESINYGIYGPEKSSIIAANTTTDGKAGFISLIGYSGNASSPYGWGGIGGGKMTTVGDGQYGGYLSLWTTSGGENGQTASASYERMRITSGGNVGIGTTSTYYGSTTFRAAISSADHRVMAFNGVGTSSVWWNGNGSPQFAIDSVSGGGAAFWVNNGSWNEAMRIVSTGQLVKYGDSTSARIIPAVDNVGYVGDSGQRWQAIYAVNGTIQTSDGREKTDILDSDLGLDFIKKLRPVSYKWKVGENIVTEEKVTDENGETKTKTIVTPRAGVRSHYGFIAQEIEETLGGKDFGGFLYDQENDKYSLRYAEFISPIIKAIQEQNLIIQELKAEIEILKTK